MMLFILLSLFIVYAIFLYVRNVYRLKKYFKRLKRPQLTTEALREIASEQGKSLPAFAIFVPARNEGYVIANTVRRLAELDYPKDFYRIFVIVDERELNDNVEILTKDVVTEIADHFNQKHGSEFIQILEVPVWYSGELGDLSKTSHHSTKGRALNYGLQQLDNSKKWTELELIGVVDADGRFDKNVLKEVALQRLKFNARLLQGPVFQLSNFDKVSTVGILAGLELAIHHMTEVPYRLLGKKKKLQLLAGTNYFVEVKLLVELGGWDRDSLVDDAELALRIYAQKQITASWFSWPEIEQTVPSFTAYRKQRERWIRGYLDLVKYIKKAEIPLSDKIWFISRTYLLLVRVVLDVGAMVLGWIIVFSGVLRNLAPPWPMLLLFWLIISMIIWDFYGLMYRQLAGYINPEMKNNHKIRRSLQLFFSMPFFVFVQSIPKVTAFFKYAFKINDETWYKTERTKEAFIE